MPDWFADAKLGMWNHWGPQSAAEYGDWYARRMYVQGEPQYQHHLEHYGHPSKTGFVDVIKSWKADKFDADYLMSLYQKAGAKYYVATSTACWMS
jgi:alpha-L-fucosidase